MSKDDWRLAAPYEYVANLERKDIAWELLRREAGYQRDCDGSRGRTDQGGNRLANRWGLRFPG